MLEAGLCLLVVVALAGVGLAIWMRLRGPAPGLIALALRLSTVVVLASLVVTFSAWKLSKARTHQLLGNIVPRIETDQRVVALTFDDGPSDQLVEEILQVLARGNVSATFFVTGKALARKPNMGRRLVEQGHELGNHTFRHQRMVLRPLSFILDEIEDTDLLIRQAGQKGEIHFRAPGGKKLILLPYYLWQTGRANISWDVAPEGYGGTPDNPERIVQEVLESTQPGSIILLHVMAKNRPASREALPGIIDGLQERGYRFVTISELLALSREDINRRP